MASKDEMSSKLSNLSLQQDKSGKNSKPKEEVADSWEDEDVSDTDDGPTTPKAATSSDATPAAPPPTPASPNLGPPEDWAHPDTFTGAPSSTRGDGRRPEKTDAVARRLIAAGLGLKAPKQTDEQRAYQKSVREQERKRRDQERAEQQKKVEALEKAKASVWDD